MQSVSMVLSTVCVSGVFFLISDFVQLWLGRQYVLSELVLVAVVCNLYFSISLLPIWVFREATGLYRKTKYVMLATAVINLVLSVILGKMIGLAGIIFATAIARLTTYFLGMNHIYCSAIILGNPVVFTSRVFSKVLLQHYAF